MATLEDILKLWEEDSKIDETQLGHESARNPMIHSKYITHLARTKLQLRKAESDYLTIRKTKWRYFRGEMGKEELATLEWPQYQGRIPTKADLDEMLNTDPDLVKLTDKISYFTTTKETLESILKEIASRVWSVKTAFEDSKMKNGLM